MVGSVQKTPDHGKDSCLTFTQALAVRAGADQMDVPAARRAVAGRFAEVALVAAEAIELFVQVKVGTGQGLRRDGAAELGEEYDVRRFVLEAMRDGVTGPLIAQQS